MAKPHILPDGLVPEVKLDGLATAIAAGMTDEKARELFSTLGATAVLIVEVAAVHRSEFATDEEKLPQVKLRVINAETANDQQARPLREAMRAMYRDRRINGTLDELGPGPRDPGDYLADVVHAAPTEDELRDHQGFAPRR